MNYKVQLFGSENQFTEEERNTKKEVKIVRAQRKFERILLETVGIYNANVGNDTAGCKVLDVKEIFNFNFSLSSEKRNIITTREHSASLSVLPLLLPNFVGPIHARTDPFFPLPNITFRHRRSISTGVIRRPSIVSEMMAALLGGGVHKLSIVHDSGRKDFRDCSDGK